MISTFLDYIYEKALASLAFSNFDVLLAYTVSNISYPIDKTYVSFGTEFSNADSLILGAKNSAVFKECLVVDVVCDEDNGGTYCDECAKNVCIEILKLDTDKMIGGVSVSKCCYDKSVRGYRVTIKFSMRENQVSFSEE